MGRVLSPAPSAATRSPSGERPVRVLIVDDSAVMRRLIRTGLASHPRIEVVGEAENASAARAEVKRLNPDVMTLDIEMPGMDGLEFLSRLMRARPMPVIMLSSMTAAGSDAALRALALGAVDCVEKPRGGTGSATLSRLTEKVLMAATAQVRPRMHRGTAQQGPAKIRGRWNGKWVLIGASTGGVEAIETVLRDFPADCPPTLITQHMPENFLARFAARLDMSVLPTVRLAHDGDRPVQGSVLIAPGGPCHLAIDKDASTVRLVDRPKRSGHRPSVDVLFESGVPQARKMIAVLLTGMGRDGAAEMKALRAAGALCVGQDQSSCVVYGMPRVARDLGATEVELPLDRIAGHVLDRAFEPRRRYDR